MRRTGLTGFHRGNAHNRRLRRKFHRGIPLPLKQEGARLDEDVGRALEARRVDDPTGAAARRCREAALDRGERILRERHLSNKLYALEGLGDMEPLSTRSDLGITENDRLKYDSAEDLRRSAEPPVSYGRKMARRLAEGNMWPRAPLTTEEARREVPVLRDRGSLSPSAQKFSRQLEYHLRRQLKACPAHIAELIDFTQLSVQEVLASRRSRLVYIVWSTVHPGARYEIEPHLHKLERWIRFVVVTRLRCMPSIPQVRWVYHQGDLPRQLPRDVQRDMRQTHMNIGTTTEQRLEYLRSLDSVAKRLEGVPWFMPYLWAKDGRAEKKRVAQSDYEALASARKAEDKQPGSAHSPSPPTYVP